MVYLDNITDSQEVWIPRNDGLGFIHTGTSGSYQDGFEDGKEYQQSLLASTGFTSNGSYFRLNGWNHVSVNVPQTGGTGNLENKTVVIDSDITTVTPSSGYDGMSAVTVDASEYGQTNYDNGFDDGFSDGYSSGSSEERAKLSAVTFTANTAVTLSDGGYSAVTVNVEGGGGSADIGSGSFSTNGKYYAEDENLDGYSAVTINVDNAKVSGGESISITANGTTVITPRSYGINVVQSNRKIKITANGYTSRTYVGYIEDDFKDVGYIDIWCSSSGVDYDDDEWEGERLYISYTGNTMEIEVDDSSYRLSFIGDGDTGDTYDGFSLVEINTNVPTTGHTDQELDDAWQDGYDSGFTDGYSSGYTDGEQSIIDTFTSTTINENGVYGDSAHPFTSVTVNVPTSGGTSILGSGSFSANGTYSASTENLDGYNVLTIDVPQDYTQEDIDEAYESGYTDCLGSLDTVSFSANGVYNADSGEGWNTVIVNVPTSSSSAILGELNISENGVYIAENDGLTGYSAVTVNTLSESPYGELYALYCVNASFGEFSYSETFANRMSDCYNIQFHVFPLSDVHIKISGKHNQTNSNVIRDLNIQYDPSGSTFTLDHGGITEKTGRLKAVSSLDEFDKIDFTNRTEYAPAYFEYIDEDGGLVMEPINGYKMNKRAIGISGACFYLLNYFNCSYHIGIDSYGRAYYAEQLNTYYPTRGRCYPVFRKLVNGVYRYTVVDAVNAPTTPQNNYI